jgi:hypothetical protein
MRFSPTTSFSTRWIISLAHTSRRYLEISSLPLGTWGELGGVAIHGLQLGILSVAAHERIGVALLDAPAQGFEE